VSPDPTEPTTNAPSRKAPPVAFGPGAAARRRQRALVGILSAPELAGAAGGAIVVEHGDDVGDVQRPAFRNMRRLAFGDEPLAGFWGDDPVVDALRARILRGFPGGTSATPPVRWDGFLGWAGARLADGLLASAPRDTLPACAASLAAAGGCAFALDALLARAPQLGEQSFDVLSLLALRAAMGGSFRPGSIPWLIPATTALQRTEVRGRSGWASALLALRAYREAGHSSGVACLTAALAATWFRERFRAVAREGGLTIPPRPWGGPQVQASSGDAVWLGMGLVRKDPPAFRRADRPPWPKGWGGPALPLLEERLAAYAGCSVTVAREVFLDDRLATAAVFVLTGDVLGGLAVLASARTPAILEGARAALERALSGAARPEPLPELPVSRETESLFRRLLHFPDPSVALRTPHTMIEGNRGALLSRLVGEGRAADASAVRTMLDRRDLLQALAPYWLLSAAPESRACVTRLARWLATKTAMPGEEECRLWIRARWPGLLEAAH